MTFKYLVAAGALAAGLAGCSSGDIAIEPATNVTNSNNTTNNGSDGGNNGGANPNEACASYVNSAGQAIRGTYDGTNCTYSPSFVDAGNNLMFDLTIPALASGGAHIFQGSLFVGESYSTDAEKALADLGKKVKEEKHYDDVKAELEAIRKKVTVNKANAASIAVYRKRGFSVRSELRLEIGAGFVMDDYVMSKRLA